MQRRPIASHPCLLLPTASGADAKKPQATFAAGIRNTAAKPNVLPRDGRSFRTGNSNDRCVGCSTSSDIGHSTLARLLFVDRPFGSNRCRRPAADVADVDGTPIRGWFRAPHESDKSRNLNNDGHCGLYMLARIPDRIIRIIFAPDRDPSS